MAQESVTDNNENKTDQRLEAVKELLFGQNVQEYREEFKELRDQIAALDKKLTKKNEELESKLSERIDHLEAKLDSQLSAMNNLLEEKLQALDDRKIDKKQLASLLTGIAKQLD